MFDYEKTLMGESMNLTERIPLYVDINPSGKCSQHCRWCIGINKNIPPCCLDREVLIRLIDDIHGMNIPCVVFDGFYGDPLLNENTLEAMDRAMNYGISVGLGTNGVLLDRKAMETVVHSTYIRISLDSYRNDIYNLFKGTKGKMADQVVDNVRNLVELKYSLGKKTRIGLSFMLQKENIEDLEFFSFLSKNLGVDYIQFKLAFCYENGFDISKTKRDIENCRKKFATDKFSIFSDLQVTEKREKRCFIPYFIPVIGPDGNVYTCCENSYREDYSYGNIRENSLSDIWFGQKKKDVTDGINASKCEVCSRHNWRINNFVNKECDEN
jgi:radical SAM protein with 4Fe4S-binding SPASM domain